MGPTLLYPNGWTTPITDLSNTAVELVGGQKRLAVNRLILVGGAAAEIVIGRNTAGTVEYFRFPVPIATIVNIDLHATFEDGLEVLTASAAGDVSVFCNYVKP